MSVSTFLFYCANVLLGFSYVAIAALTFQPGGITGKVQQTRVQVGVSVTFFLTGAAFHADIAWHAFTVTPFFDPYGVIEWDFAGIIFVQMATVLLSMWLIRRDKQRDRRDGADQL